MWHHLKILIRNSNVTDLHMELYMWANLIKEPSIVETFNSCFTDSVKALTFNCSNYSVTPLNYCAPFPAFREVTNAWVHWIVSAFKESLNRWHHIWMSLPFSMHLMQFGFWKYHKSFLLKSKSNVWSTVIVWNLLKCCTFKIFKRDKNIGRHDKI